MAERIPVDVVSTRWDHNGTLTVVLDTPWPRTESTDRAARRRVRRELSGTRRTRITRVSPVLHNGKVRMTLTATRLEG